MFLFADLDCGTGFGKCISDCFCRRSDLFNFGFYKDRGVSFALLWTLSKLF